MLSRHRQLLASALFALDAVVIFLSWLAAYALRFRVLGLSAPLGVPPLSLYLWIGAVLTPVAHAHPAHRSAIYRSARTARLRRRSCSRWRRGSCIVTAALAAHRLVLHARRAVALGAARVRHAGDAVALRQPRSLIRFALRRAAAPTAATCAACWWSAPASRRACCCRKIAAHPDFGLRGRGHGRGRSRRGRRSGGRRADRWARSRDLPSHGRPDRRRARLPGARALTSTGPRRRRSDQLDDSTRRGAAGAGPGARVHAERQRRGLRRPAGGARDREPGPGMERR